MISPQLIDELKTIIKEEYMVELFENETYDLAQMLIGSFELLIKSDAQNKSILPKNRNLQEMP